MFKREHRFCSGNRQAKKHKYKYKRDLFKGEHRLGKEDFSLKKAKNLLLKFIQKDMRGEKGRNTCLGENMDFFRVKTAKQGSIKTEKICV